MPSHILPHPNRQCCHCNANYVTLGVRIDDFANKHPFISFLVFLGIAFLLMALVGLNDCGDRVSGLGGM